MPDFPEIFDGQVVLADGTVIDYSRLADGRYRYVIHRAADPGRELILTLNQFMPPSAYLVRLALAARDDLVRTLSLPPSASAPQEAE